MRRIPAITLAAGLFAAAVPDGAHWWQYVEALANDQMQGRNTGSPEHLKAAQYVAAEFEKSGLKPAGEHGFIQTVKFKARKLVESGSSLELIRDGKAERLALGEDAIIGVRTDPADSVEGPLVFAGYGLTVPEMKYDDFAGLDLRGKIIVTIAGGPSDIPGPLKSHYQFVTERARFLKQAGVAGVATIQNPRTADIPWSRVALARFQEAMSLADPSLSDDAGLKIGVTINPDHAGKWFAGSGHDLKELLALVDAGKPLPRFPLRPTLRAAVKVERRDLESQNVVAARAGSDAALKSEYVVLSAHLDHVGVGEPINGDRIYNGAMDDASGVASLLDIAAMLHEAKTQTRRSKEEEMAKQWLTNRYHAPSDDLNQPVDKKAAGQYNRLMMTLAEAVANNPQRPKWKTESFFRRFAQ